ncbi:hypothetical protein Sjap_001230 [Stephania japonica]|uniref:Uncharacterized protein n=1 Tax=Stephania japonica TaxID=461633 RepID=A0AAP0KM38_9MAGN
MSSIPRQPPPSRHLPHSLVRSTFLSVPRQPPPSVASSTSTPTSSSSTTSSVGSTTSSRVSKELDFDSDLGLSNRNVGATSINSKSSHTRIVFNFVVES